jgi:hypothetical protein
MKTTDYILLKWGTIKGYSLKHSDATFELMYQVYETLRASTELNEPHWLAIACLCER